jgi:iron complex transport system ATP-binding protein
MLEARDVTVRYPGHAAPAVSGLSLAVTPRRLVAVVGPNGSGKTTVLRALVGAVPVASGEVLLEGKPIGAWPGPLRARRIAAVAQREEYPFAWKVREVVEFGRYPWLSATAALREQDRSIVDQAMARADVVAVSDRRIDTLSGGEWQRVRIARALAQEPAILLLDEPTASLDLGHEMEVFELTRELVDGGLAGLVVTHHLNLAARFADLMILLDRGRPVATGLPRDVLDAGRLCEVFGWPIEVTVGPDGVPQVSAVRRPGSAGTGSLPSASPGGYRFS